MELSIDTSTRYASVSLAQKGDLVAALTWTSKQNHSVELTVISFDVESGTCFGDGEYHRGQAQ